MLISLYILCIKYSYFFLNIIILKLILKIIILFKDIFNNLDFIFKTYVIIINN